MLTCSNLKLYVGDPSKQNQHTTSKKMLEKPKKNPLKRLMCSLFTVHFSYFLVLIVVITAAGKLHAQERGGYAGSFLRLGLGARAKGMGGAFVGMPGDGYSAYYNPAGLPDLSSREAVFSYRDLSLGREFYYAGFAANIEPAAGLAIGWIHAGVSGIDGRDMNGVHTRTYDDDQNAFLFAAGIKIKDDLNIGAGGTVLRENLVDITATGFGLNAGILWKPSNTFAVGAAVRDLDAHFSWNSESLYAKGSAVTDDYPAVYTAGTSIHLERYNTVILFDIFKNTRSGSGYRWGFENRYFNPVTLRAGINNGELTAGFGIGLTLGSSEGYIDFAFESIENDPESPQILSFGIIF